MTIDIHKIYSKILQTGLPEGVSFKEKIKIELSNQFILLGLTCVFLHNIVNLFFLHSLVDFCLTMVWFGVLAPALLFNIFHKPHLAKLQITFIGILSTFVLHLLFGPGLKLEPMYLLYMVMGTLFFDYSSMRRYGVSVVVLFSLATLINSQYDPIFADLVRPSGAITRFIFCVAMIASLIGKLIIENRLNNQLINTQNENLSKYNHRLKSFNYIVSHDLKEPLRNIVGFSQLLKKGTEKGSQKNNAYLSHIIQSTNQLNKLINDLKDFTNSEEKELSLEPVRLDQIIKDINSSLVMNHSGQQPIITCTSFPQILSSRIALTIIFRNLIENGIKYNDNQQPKIAITGSIANGMAHIQIKDNGIGIEEKYFEEVFELFTRLNSKYEKGSGLGLNITKNLISRLNGKLFIAQSTIGQGSVFQLNFPAQIYKGHSEVISPNTSKKFRSTIHTAN